MVPPGEQRWRREARGLTSGSAERSGRGGGTCKLQHRGRASPGGMWRVFGGGGSGHLCPGL